ncbi:MAG: hypothetical protein AAB092_00870 [Chloroflexota bacterium]
MPEMPQSVAKGPILTRFDQFSQSAANLQDLKANLAVDGESSNVVAILNSHNLLTADEANHLERDWFDRDGDGWWKTRQPIQPIIAKGFIEAIDKALEPTITGQEALPLDCYWICDTGHNEPGHIEAHLSHPQGEDGAVEVAVMWNSRQVTVLIQTPSPGISHFPLGDLVPEPIKVIAQKNPPGGDRTIIVVQPMAHADGKPHLA